MMKDTFSKKILDKDAHLKYNFFLNVKEEDKLLNNASERYRVLSTMPAL